MPGVHPNGTELAALRCCVRASTLLGFGLVVEPSAALGIAAVIEDRNRFASRHVVTIVCGSNVDIDAYHRWVGASP